MKSIWIIAALFTATQSIALEESIYYMDNNEFVQQKYGDVTVVIKQRKDGAPDEPPERYS